MTNKQIKQRIKNILGVPEKVPIEWCLHLVIYNIFILLHSKNKANIKSDKTAKWAINYHGIVIVKDIFITNNKKIALIVGPYSSYNFNKKYKDYIPDDDEILEILTETELKQKYIEYAV